MNVPCQFETLVLDRQIKTSPDRLFALMTDPAARKIWGAPTEGVVIEIDQSDIRPGGRELARCGPKDAPDFSTVTDFHLIAAPHQMVLTETLSVGGALMSISLATQEITPTETGSHLKVTLQIVSLTGPETFEGYSEGWGGALDNLARLAEAVPVQ